MTNPVQSKSSFERCIVQGCCFCMTLKNGTLAIGILQLVFGILWLINSSTGVHGTGHLTGFVGAVLDIIAGILCIVGVRKESARFLWYSVYIMVGICVWMVIYIIIAFVTLVWAGAVMGILNFLLLLYFTSVVRSYAFELDTTSPTVTA